MSWQIEKKIHIEMRNMGDERSMEQKTLIRGSKDRGTSKDKDSYRLYLREKEVFKL